MSVRRRRPGQHEHQGDSHAVDQEDRGKSRAQIITSLQHVV